MVQLFEENQTVLAELEQSHLRVQCLMDILVSRLT